MVIAFEFNSFWGGAAMSLREYARLAQEAGHVVYAFTSSLEWRQVVDEYNIPIEVHPSARPQRIDQLWRLARWYAETTKRLRVDLVHSVIPGFFPALDWAQGRVGFGILYGKASPSDSFPSAFRRNNERMWIAYNKEYAKVLLNHGVPSVNIKLIPNRFRFSKQTICNSDRRRDRVRIAWVGRITAGKSGALRSLLSWAEDCQFDDILEIHVIGNGDHLQEMQALVKLRINQERVHVFFHGYLINYSEIIKKCDIVCGVGRCAIEALAMGKMVVVTRNDGAACLVSPDNFTDLADSNFTGRGLILHSIGSVMQMSISLGSCSEYLDRLVKMVFDHYDIEMVRSEVIGIYDAVSRDRTLCAYPFAMVRFFGDCLFLALEHFRSRG